MGGVIMSREFELILESAQLCLDPKSSTNGKLQVRNFLIGLRMGAVNLNDCEQVVMRLSYGDSIDPRTGRTPGMGEVFAGLAERERHEIKLQVANLAGNLREWHPDLVAEFPEQFR